MPSLNENFPEIRDALADRYGEPKPIDAEPFPAILATYLGQSFESHKVALSLDGLRDSGLIEPEALIEAHESEINDAVRSSGMKLAPKAIATVKKLANWAGRRIVEELAEAPTESLRDDLRAINGIGAATADALLLDALNRPVYPVDQSSYRVFARHGWIDTNADYEEARSTFESCEPNDSEGLRRLAFRLEKVATEFCKASKPKCERCPLKPFLPANGPVEAEGE